MRSQLSFAKPIEAYRGRRRGGRWAILLFFAALVVSGFVVLLLVYRSTGQVVDEGAPTLLIEIEAGSGAPEIAQQLLERELVVSEYAFNAAVFIEGARGKLQAGTYELSGAMSARQIVEIMRDGQTQELRVTIPEGLRLDEVATLLEQAGVADADDFLQATREDYAYTFLQSKPSDQDLEGFLFPDTYHFMPEVTARQVVEKMLENFEQKIVDLLGAFEADDRSLYEILTLASIVEGEVPHSQDRPVVAGVFVNRLEDNIPLQADSTLAFLTKRDTIEFSVADTEIDDLYNTYRYAGLPPGPINSPGLESIMAALNPEPTEFYYFISDPETDETHFAKTLDDHNANVARYLSD